MLDLSKKITDFSEKMSLISEATSDLALKRSDILPFAWSKFKLVRHEIKLLRIWSVQGPT